MKRHQYIIKTNQKYYLPDDRDTPLCPRCEQEPESSEHILAQCGAFNEIRFKYFGSYQLHPPFNNLRKSAVVSFLREGRIDALSFFMESE